MIGLVPVPPAGGTVNVAFLGAVNTLGTGWLSAAVLLPLLVVGPVAGAVWHLRRLIADLPPASGELARRWSPLARCDLAPVTVAGRPCLPRPPVWAVVPARAPPTSGSPSDLAVRFRR